VIFAGAGISAPAGLPDFKGLVEDVYKSIPEAFEGAESRLFRNGEYDRVLGLLEARVDRAMRKAVVERLRRADDIASSVHQNIIDIAQAGNRGRVVTTNFDRLFLAAGLDPQQITAGPQLPVPRPAHWNGLVHLHGIIDDSDPEGRNLVLTSADFGRAYLLDRWAARFVTELFQNFDVLFVGYGVNDPVMRYLLDALAAERSKGGKFRSAFALAGIKGREKEQERLREEWASKGLEPIFYHCGWNHRLLVRTLRNWAELCRGGLRTRQSWVLRYADNPPPNPQDDDARFVVWALSESSGAVAQAFAEKNPAPPIGWLKIFEESDELPFQAKLLELPSDEVECGEQGEDRRPRAPIADTGWRTGRPPALSKVTSHLAGWLARHLDKTPPLEWALKKGGVLHPEFRRSVQLRLQPVNQKNARLPEPFQKVWEILASDVYSERAVANRMSGYWPSLLELAASSLVGRQELLRLVAPVPQLILRQADDLRVLLGNHPPPSKPASVEDLVELKVEVSGGTEGELLLDELSSPGSDPALLSKLADDAVALLEQALEWMSLGGQADDREDLSHITQPSISSHPQNRNFHAWTRYIDLNRRIFEALDRTNSDQARHMVDCWRSRSFPLFRRLVLFAATDGESIDPSSGAELLLECGIGTLWNRDEQREVMRFLRKAGGRLSEDTVERLSSAILDGPPANTWREDLTKERRTELTEGVTWKRLVRLQLAGAQLPKTALDFLKRIEETRNWSIPEDLRDEFPFWLESRSGEPEEREEWRSTVRRRPGKCLARISRETKEDRWDQERLTILLQEFGVPDYRRPFDRRRFTVLGRLLRRAPQGVLVQLLHPAAWWAQDQSGRLPSRCEDELIAVLEALLPVALHSEVAPDSDPISLSLNHPAGQLTRAILNRVWYHKPQADDGLPGKFRSLLNQITDSTTSAGRVGRLPLALDLLSLFLLDRPWAEKHLLPRFRWEESAEALDSWKNFLRKPRLNPDLLAALKEDFLALFSHLPRLGQARENAVRLLVFLAAENSEAFARNEVATTLRGLGSKDLASAAEALASLLEHSDQPDKLWRATIASWIDRHWPSRAAARTGRVSRSLVEVATRTGNAFGEAITALRSRLVPYDDEHDSTIHLLNQLNVPSHFPEEVLELLSIVVPDRLAKPWSWSSLRDILEDIARQSPELTEEGRFRRLDGIVRAGSR